jgi:UDP-glucose 4-epimerase
VKSKREHWLVTGGAGYIGSHVVDQFISDGKNVIVFDSLSTGKKSRIEFLEKLHNSAIPLVVGDIRNKSDLGEVFRKYSIDGVVHTAALKSVAESMLRPDLYLEVNLNATKNLLTSMRNFQIPKIIFSSTAAVYGSPNLDRSITENDVTDPISPYGLSKLMAESEITKYIELENGVGASLRFFNVIGAAHPELLDNSVDNLVPIVIEKLLRNEQPIVFGNDYDTPDGTCIRDYVDVRDIARAHLAIANSPKNSSRIFNVGTGQGKSVIDVIQVIKSLLSKNEADIEFAKRRKGDSAILISDSSLIGTELNFQCKYRFLESLESSLVGLI